MLAKAPRGLRSWEKLTRISLFSRSSRLQTPGTSRILLPSLRNPGAKLSSEDLNFKFIYTAFRSHWTSRALWKRACAPGPCQQGSNSSTQRQSQHVLCWEGLGLRSTSPQPGPPTVCHCLCHKNQTRHMQSIFPSSLLRRDIRPPQGI